MPETDSEPKTKDDIYRERNILALAFLQATKRECDQAGLEWNGGWWPDEDAVNGEEWAVVWFEDEHKGQFGWHVPMSMVPDWLEKRDPKYDGYSTADKYQRLWQGWVEQTGDRDD